MAGLSAANQNSGMNLNNVSNEVWDSNGYLNVWDHYEDVRQQDFQYVSNDYGHFIRRPRTVSGVSNMSIDSVDSVESASTGFGDSEAVGSEAVGKVREMRMMRGVRMTLKNMTVMMSLRVEGNKSEITQKIINKRIVIVKTSLMIVWIMTNMKG